MFVVDIWEKLDVFFLFCLCIIYYKVCLNKKDFFEKFFCVVWMERKG